MRSSPKRCTVLRLKLLPLHFPSSRTSLSSLLSSRWVKQNQQSSTRSRRARTVCPIHWRPCRTSPRLLGPISSFGTSLNASLRHGQDGTEERSSSDITVSAPELLRLKKRFMKLDKDGSGTIDRDEFLQIPQIANNPLAHRMIAIFDEE